MNHPLRYRVAALLGVTMFFVIAYAIYDHFAEPVTLGPEHTLLSDTWFGPYVLLLIPALLGWVSLAARWIWLRVLGLIVALCLFVCCLGISGVLSPPGGVY